MLALGLRVILIAAVLVQYTPLRRCAVECATTEATCHEAAPAGFCIGQADHPACGTCGGGEHKCVCEQPKSQAPSESSRDALPDCCHHAIVFLACAELAAPIAFALPSSIIPASLNTPLLI